MKNLFYLFLIGLMAACSSDSVQKTGRSGDVFNSSEGSGGGSGLGGSMARFNIAGDYMYVVSNNSLYTFSLSDPSTPDLKSETRIQSFVETIFHMNGYLFLGTQNGVLIYNVQNPVNPAYVSTYTHIVSCDPVVASGDWAYATLRTESSCTRGVNQLDIIDISTITQPSLHHSFQMSNPKGLGISGSKLYVCDGNDLKQFDISNPAAVSAVEKTYPMEGGYDIIPVNDLLIATTSEGIIQYRIETDGSLTYLSSILVR